MDQDPSVPHGETQQEHKDKRQVPEVVALRPVDKAVQKAREELERAKASLLAAGVTEDQVAQAAMHREQTIRAEFEERDREDPLNAIARVMHEAAQTDDQRSLANMEAWVMQNSSRDWLHRRAISRQDDRPNGPSEWRGGYEWWPTVDIIWNGRSPDGRDIYADTGYVERVFRNLGALEEDQGLMQFLGDAQELPIVDTGRFEHASKRGLLREKDPTTGNIWLRGIPTATQGLELRVNMDHLYHVQAAFSPAVLTRVQPPAQPR